MTPTYADTCLSRAEKATPGPWVHEKDSLVVRYPNNYRVCSIGSKYTTLEDLSFIAASPTMVVELATRLKRACEQLRHAANLFFDEEFIESAYFFSELADELEAAPKGEG